MTTQICLKCQEDSFSWSIDDEDKLLTQWGCNKCYYQAFENESDQRICSNCKKETESKLKDDTKNYWWCSNCGTKKITKVQ
ncbi:hypothetical protein [uncultured Aquimarina sp.]|uniref:hypothetical protein n=1 Tax=uncultured Aquimarina sp. TaxID=575652 RepID=UPI0026378B71|nr:hypothetical protein [uncultured Aquimarina sp.]